ncbi:MAG: aminoacyl-tRNA hydrolase [Dehalococcoidia bacterium]|nr:aminoacyl-tRNA hydrolase [Dehalococcoidia bacterium]
MKLIVGLGNPGREYANSRHNVGFMCLNRFARKYSISFNKTLKRSRVAVGKICDEDVLLAKPRTYMNLSGESVSLLLKGKSLSRGDLIVVHDDLDLPLGKLRIRSGGGSGGHKGVASIISCLGTGDFIRVRVGIGHPDDIIGNADDEDVVNYVLAGFTTDEKLVVKTVVEEVVEAISCIVTDGMMVAMNGYN